MEVRLRVWVWDSKEVESQSVFLEISGGGDRRVREKNEEGERACVFKKCILEL